MPKKIYEAIETNDWERAQQAIQTVGKRINSQDFYGWTPLHLAVSLGRESKWLKLLLEHGADPNISSDSSAGSRTSSMRLSEREIPKYEGATPLHYVQSIEQAQLLLDAGAYINAHDDSSYTLLDRAINAANKPLVEFLLRSGARFDVRSVQHFVKLGIDIKEQDDKGRTFLHRAVIWRNRSLVEFLLRSGADINIIDNSGKTPLHYVDDDLGILRFLVKAGADVNSQDQQGDTPLHSILKRHIESHRYHSKTPELLLFLFWHGGDIALKNRTGKTPFDLASESGLLQEIRNAYKEWTDFLLPLENNLNVKPFHYVNAVEHARLLLNAGADINVQNDNGETLLHQAVSSCNVELIKFLLESGADCNIKDDCGRTALYYAADAEIMKTLVNAGGNISVVDENECTLLEWFMRENVNWEIVKFLLESGIEVPEYLPSSSADPIDTACSEDQLDIVKLLYEGGIDYYNYAHPEPCHIICPETEYTRHVPADKKRWDLFCYLMKTKERDFSGSCAGCEYSPLVVAVKQGEWEIIKNVLSRIPAWAKDFIDLSDYDGDTLLTLAADSKNTEMIQLLIEHGANPNANDQGYFLLSRARHDSDFLIFLLEHGVDANATGTNSDFIEYGYDDVVPIIAEYVEWGDVEGVKILKQYGAKITPELLKIECIHNDDEMKQLLRGFLVEKE